MGKLIYQPKGKAKEYSPWACNLYNGCSNKCDYCYNRHCPAKDLLGKDDVTLKKGLNDKSAEKLFVKELLKYKDRILADGKGLFFNFVSDPFIDETWRLNYECANDALMYGVPVVFLSKRIPTTTFTNFFVVCKDKVKVGYTLTGHDELEPGADTNETRIDFMRQLVEHGVNIWASIEPVIDIESSFKMIQQAYIAGCREFKIGLLSGKKAYTSQEVAEFKDVVDMTYSPDCNILWKESVLDYISKNN